jgi:hypothetical protein
VAKPFSILRTASFLGENDDTPVAIDNDQATTLQDWLKDRKKLKRRKGTSALGSASLSPDESLHGLAWCRIDGTEALVGVHDDDVVDFLDSPVGTIINNGTARLPAETDANFAFVNNTLYMGNGTDANLRFHPGDGTSDTAADLNGSSQDYVNTSSTDLESGDLDYSVACWVYLDTAATPQVIVSKWSATTSSQREYRLWFDNSVAKFKMSVWEFGGGTGQDAAADDGSAIVAGEWYYVVGWHDSVGNVVGCQVNNATAVTAAWSLGTAGTTVDFYIGRQADIAAYLDGRVMRVGYWKSAGGAGGVLSAGQKTSLYNSGSGKPYSSMTAGEKVALIAFWGLNNASGDDEHSALATNNVTPEGTPTVANGVDTDLAIAVAMTPKPATSPTVDLDVGATHDSSTENQAREDFSYRISFLNADGIPGEPCDAANDAAYTFNLDFTSNLTAIPLCPAGNDCTGRRIYRKSGGHSLYRFVADINDNTTTTYLDAVLNADLGDELPADTDGFPSNVAFPPAKYLISHQRRMVGAGNASSPDTLYISNVDEPYYCPESPDLEDPNQGTRDRIDSPAGGEITGLASHGGVVAVFTGGEGFLLQGVEPNSFAVNKFTNVGCAAHRTICSAKSLLIWLGHDGVYAWDGTSTKRISDDQRVTLDAMTAAEMAGANAYVYDDRYHLNWATGSIWFDLEHGIWGTYSNWLWRCTAQAPFTSGNRPRLWGAIQGAARVYLLETGATDAGTNISAVWEGRDQDMGQAGREKRVHFIELKFKATTIPATCLWTLKRGTGETIDSGAVNINQVDSSGATVSRHYIPVNEAARDEHFRLRLAVSSATAEVVLLSAGMHYTYV